MSSICRMPNGRKAIQFSEKEIKGRPKIHLGKTSLELAKSVRSKVQALIAAKKAGLSIDSETAAWLGGISDELHKRLVVLGLVQPRDEQPASTTLGSILNAYIAKRARLKPNTLRNYKTTQRLLETHFGKDRIVNSIHAGHARDYREWLVAKYATATVSREIKRARQFFEYVKDHRLTTENPFAKIKAGSQKNTKRKYFVDRNTIDKVLESCPDNNWRLLIVLARYGGLRVPSELQQLTWNDIDWHNGKFTVRVPKKDHIDGHEMRVVPIFPEIRPYLQQAFEEAQAGCVYVLPKRFHAAGYAYAGVKRAVERAGINPWEKLLQNLRATRETELMRTEPAHLVYTWLGNSREVAEDHYLMATDDDYKRASAAPTVNDTRSKTVQNPVQPATVRSRQTPSTEKWKTENPANARYTADQAPPRGVEPRFSD